MGMKTPYPADSSGESWAMRVSVTQQNSGVEDDYGSCKSTT